MINWKCGGIEIKIPLPNNIAKSIANFGGYNSFIVILSFRDAIISMDEMLEFLGFASR